MNKTRQNKMSKRLGRSMLAIVCLLAGNLLFFLTIWMASKYDKVTLDQFIYQMKSSAAGANRSIFNSAVVRVGVFGVVSTILELALYWLCRGEALRARFIRKFRNTKFARFVSRRAVALVMAILVFSACLFTVELNLVQFVSAATTESVLLRTTMWTPTTPS